MARFELAIPREQVDLFFRAVGWSLPVRPVMPPTLATTFRAGEFEALRKLGIPLSAVLHGEQKYRFRRDLAPGTDYRGVTSLSSRFEKAGKEGSLKFLVFETRLWEASAPESPENEDACVECVTTVVVRSRP